MHIEPIGYSSFQSLVSCTHAFRDPDNKGCGWYASIDRRYAGRVYLDSRTATFRVTLLHFVRAGWEVEELTPKFERFEDAKLAVNEAMKEKRDSIVTTMDVPMRARFGKGRRGRRAS